MQALVVTLLAIGHASAIYRPPALQRHAIVPGKVECSDNVTFQEYQDLDGDRLASFGVMLQAGSGAKFLSSEGGFQDGIKLSTDYVGNRHLEIYGVGRLVL
ncbi:hypothetical protein AAVH_07346 [Aphelenchoides avenae]|nr:hypothetical protein AAVH_07346 [Aphelenchus avenae]